MDTLRTLGREHSNKRGIRPGDPRCEHDKPMLVENTEGGQRYARCLCCQAAGPQRPNSKAARQALLVMGARRPS